MKFYKLLLTIIILFSIGCSNDKNSDLKIISSNLNKNLENALINSYYDSEIYAVDGNHILGSIMNMNSNPTIFKTEQLFLYNIEDNNIIFYDFDIDGRVYDFKVYNNNIYYIILNEDENDKFNWYFVKYETKNNKNTILREGTINDPINTPLILGKYDNNLVLFFINIEKSSIQYEFSKFSLNNDEFQELIQGEGSIDEKKGSLPYNVYNYYLSNNYIYYALIDENGYQKLHSYNLENNISKLIFENNKKNSLLYSYKINDQYEYFQIIYPYDIQSEILVREINNDFKKVISDINTFENFISPSQIICHNEGDKWKILNLDNLKYDSIKFETSAMPLYHKINQNQLLIKSKNNKYYIENIKN